MLYFKVDEEGLWKELSSTVEGCRSYLKRFPEGKYRVLAEKTIAKDRELKSWARAKASGLKSALLDFELDYPQSTPVLSGELQRLLEELEEEELWARAKQSNTITAYRSYLLRTISKLHAIEAEQAIKAIAQKEKEPAQWQKAQQLNSIAGYEAYLREYPEGSYAQEAKRVLARIRDKEKKEQPRTLSREDEVQKNWIPLSLDARPIQATESKSFFNAKSRWAIFIALYVVLMLVVGNQIWQAVTSQDKKPGTQFTILPNSLDSNIIGDFISPVMILIPGGDFKMGSNAGETDEKPIHLVHIDSFYLSKYEVTVAEYKQFIDATSYQTDADKDGGSYAWDGKSWPKTAGVNWKCDPEGKARPSTEYNHPVIHVSWNDATEYAKWLSKKTSLNYRLPTEAEWEYAAGNGGKHTKYSWGNGDPAGKKGGNVSDETAKRKFSGWPIFEGYDDGFLYTAPVGSFNANEFGLHDMSGNVWEWCQDWHADGYYAKSPASNPSGPTSGSDRVVRGGSWYDFPIGARVANRGRDSPGDRNILLGFRLARQQ